MNDLLALSAPQQMLMPQLLFYEWDSLNFREIYTEDSTFTPQVDCTVQAPSWASKGHPKGKTVQ